MVKSSDEMSYASNMSGGSSLSQSSLMDFGDEQTNLLKKNKKEQQEQEQLKIERRRKCVAITMMLFGFAMLCAVFISENTKAEPGTLHRRFFSKKTMKKFTHLFDHVEQTSFCLTLQDSYSYPWNDEHTDLCTACYQHAFIENNAQHFVNCYFDYIQRFIRNPVPETSFTLNWEFINANVPAAHENMMCTSSESSKIIQKYSRCLEGNLDKTTPDAELADVKKCMKEYVTQYTRSCGFV